MLDFLGTEYGFFTAGIICVTVLVMVFRLTGKNGGGLEIEKGKVKIGTAKIEAVGQSPQTALIRFDDWKKFSEILYEFCIKTMQPAKEEWYAILHCYENSISPAKKAYVERFLYFNHLPAKDTEKYEKYVRSHAEALVKSVCRDMKFITNEYDKDIPDFDPNTIMVELSEIIEKFRERRNK